MLRTVKIENGIVQGLPAADPRITSFKGIPFAAPPVGENRWRAPQPAIDWQGVLKAFAFAPVSMQSPIGKNKNDIYTREWNVDPDIPMNEDCLYLNVWTPACNQDEKLPVFVWYFGGGLQVGNTAEMEFDGERIARRGIVVVSINYRLNVFGFLCHPEITAESPEAPANFGHLDQKFATEWVKSNITAFGGDPDNITIGGQSAGGASVMHQLTSPQNENLFQKAIIQSGIFARAYPSHWILNTPSLSESEQAGIKFFEMLGVSDLAAARKLDAKYIMSKATESKRHWGSTIDGKFATGKSLDLFAENKRWKVPVMMGHTSNEFIADPKAGSIDELKILAEKLFGERADEFISLCGTESNRIEDINQQAAVNGIEYAIRIAAQANDKSGENIPFYYYNFDAEIPGWDNPGAFHSVDIWFFFETLAKCWRPFVGKHYDLARQMCNYWSNFICTGDPNGNDSTGDRMPLWKNYTNGEPCCMVFKDKPKLDCKSPGEIMRFLVDNYFSKA